MDKTLNKSLFAQVKGEVIFDTKLSDGAARFYSMVLYLSGKNDSCWYSQVELGALMGRGDRSIRNYITELEAKGYLRVVRRGFHQTNKYYPLLKVIPKSEEVIHDELPPAPGPGIDSGLNRKGPASKSHAPNNNQHDRASRPLISQNKGNVTFSKYLPGGSMAFLNPVTSSN